MRVIGGDRVVSFMQGVTPSLLQQGRRRGWTVNGAQTQNRMNSIFSSTPSPILVILVRLSGDKTTNVIFSIVECIKNTYT